MQSETGRSVLMPTVDENRDEWGSRHDWSRFGDDWSLPWGGTEQMWWGTLYPRLRAFLPAGHILEIAPGYGRITQFLHPLCDALTVVDLNERCISACKTRFAGVSHIRYHVNDGRSLAMVPDGSVDFAVSFDSLVHADADVIEAYVRQLATKLTVDGVAFLHHSNAGSYLLPLERVAQRLHVTRAAGAVSRRVNRNWRAEDMSLSRFADICRQAGLRCIAQETLNWSSKLPNDCFSTITRPGSMWDRERQISRNHGFPHEVGRMQTLSRLYGADSTGSPGPFSASPSIRGN